MRLLVLNFFPAFSPPLSGGEMRLGGLYRALSARHQVTLLSSTDFGARREEIRHAPGFTEWRFPKDELWARAYATLDAMGLAGDLSGLAFALAVSDPECALRQVAHALAPAMDRVIHEFPYSEPVFAGLQQAAAPREVYNSHNFETSLLGSVVHGAGVEAALLKLMRLEGNLARRAELVLATSAADAEKFRLFYGVPAARLALCPNGFEAAELEPVVQQRARRAGRQRFDCDQAPGRPRLLFTGSAHPPNVEAARFLASLAEGMPECDVVLAGSVGRALEASAAGPLPANLLRLGPVDPATKRRLLIEADLFLNPVTLGSGTSLKALEALGAGVAMVSTAEGVRGLDVAPGVQAAVVERSRFAETVRALLADPSAAADLAAAGRDLAARRFTWDAIADAFAARLESADAFAARLESAGVDADADAEPLILALNDYPVLEGHSGGMARIRGLLGQAGADVVLVSFGATAGFALIGTGLLHVTLPKTAAHAGFERALSEGQPASANDVAAALFVGASPLMAAVLPRLAGRAGLVLLEHCYMAPALDLIAAAWPDASARPPIVYSSHNVETTHKPPLLAGHAARVSLSRFVAELETRLVGQAQMIVCCTDADARHFAAVAGQRAAIVVVPNGCAMPARSAAPTDCAPEAGARPATAGFLGPATAGFLGSATAGFLGSAHGPNVEAALFIVRELAPRLPHVVFELIGGMCEALGSGLWPANVRLRGVLHEADKSAALAGWTIALNPVTGGGGSSLKLPDAMAHGVPSLNTPAGARGFAVAERGAGIVAERHLFGRELAALLAEPDQLAAMGRRARRYAEDELSWQAVAAPYRAGLARLLALQPGRAAAPPGRSRLLVVTYRYTEPSLGGAEEYLVEVLQRLRPRVARLDLACVDVGPLTNHHHFATRAGPGEGVTRRLGELFDRLLCLPADAVDEAATLAHCRALERAWTAEEETLLLPFAHRLGLPDRPVLFAGFYWPENHDGVLRRWTGPQFSILVPADACVLRLAGWVSQPKRLMVDMFCLPASASGDGDAMSAAPDELVRLGRLEQRLRGNFVTSLGLPAPSPGAAGELDAGVLLLRLSVEETQSPGDHRPFGVLLEAVSILRVAEDASRRPGTLSLLEDRAADFAAETERLLRAADFTGWVGALNEVAARRSPAVEAAFAAVRGPHSAALQHWLAAHGGEYDVALIQGVPFDVVPSAVATLAALPQPPRLVTLPHFHADDRFYHWRRFAESFARADATLVFTPSLPALLAAGDPALERRFAVVPGGGVRPDEHADVTAQRRFAEARPGRRPFFLVLGRKTPSKGYRRVLAAHAAHRSANPESPDLLLIGPDEDGQPVDAPGAVYLGRQSREVVRGALAGCIALISMSESESFGIVLCEAWLFGRPVIANAACYAFRDLVDDATTGLLVDTDAELIAAMARLARDPAQASAMGQAGARIVQDSYTWPRVADAIADVLWPAVAAG